MWKRGCDSFSQHTQHAEQLHHLHLAQLVLLKQYLFREFTYPLNNNVVHFLLDKASTMEGNVWDVEDTSAGLLKKEEICIHVLQKQHVKRDLLTKKEQDF